MDIERNLAALLTGNSDPRLFSEQLPAETQLRKRILERFPVLETRLHILRNKRLSLDPLSRRDFEKVWRFLCGEGGFTSLKMINAFDAGENIVINYVLSNDDDILFVIKQRVPKSAAAVRSVCSVFPGALWEERALSDLFGVRIEGLPSGPSYPLANDWPDNSYPLRKEWNGLCFDRNKMSYTIAAPVNEDNALHEPQH